MTFRRDAKVKLYAKLLQRDGTHFSVNSHTPSSPSYLPPPPPSSYLPVRHGQCTTGLLTPDLDLMPPSCRYTLPSLPTLGKSQLLDSLDTEFESAADSTAVPSHVNRVVWSPPKQIISSERFDVGSRLVSKTSMFSVSPTLQSY